MVKAAIIGCGKIAQVRHIPEYLEHQAVNLVGFYDLNEKRAEELAEKYGGKAGFFMAENEDKLEKYGQPEKLKQTSHIRILTIIGEACPL